jgi:anaerobic selenocysteine-containing dehydrogenase
VPSSDDWFHSELLLIWANNPAYSAIPWYHYIAEARYNGSQVVTIAPDYSPSAIHGDLFVPVRIGSDAALALAMCQVIIKEGLAQEDFVREQTDLSLLVRTDTRRSSRASDGDAAAGTISSTGSIRRAAASPRRRGHPCPGRP